MNYVHKLQEKMKEQGILRIEYDEIFRNYALNTHKTCVIITYL